MADTLSPSNEDNPLAEAISGSLICACCENCEKHCECYPDNPTVGKPSGCYGKFTPRLIGEEDQCELCVVEQLYHE
jgi:hypothetical protein